MIMITHIFIRNFQGAVIGGQRTPNTDDRDFKILNESNPVFKKNIFCYCQGKSHRKHNLHVHSRKTSKEP